MKDLWAVRFPEALMRAMRGLGALGAMGVTAMVAFGFLTVAALVAWPWIGQWVYLPMFGMRLAAMFLLAIFVVGLVACVALAGWLLTQPSGRQAINAKLSALWGFTYTATLAFVAWVLGAVVVLYETVAWGWRSELWLVIAALGLASTVLATALYRHEQRVGRLEREIRQVRAELRAEVELTEGDIAQLRTAPGTEAGLEPVLNAPATPAQQRPDIDSPEFELEARARGLTDQEIAQLRAESHAARARLEARMPEMERRIRRISN